MSYAIQGRSRDARRTARSLLLLPFLIFFGVSVLAAGYVAYILWPRWPAPPVAPDAPSVPVVVAGVTFNIPPGAIRRAVQRRPGAQERIDLVFLWPSLEPPATAAEAGPQPAGHVQPERIFVTIANSEGAASPVERMRTIYVRYLAHDQKPAQPGLVMFSFRNDTPYRGEDLIYSLDSPERFLLRCTRTIGPTPGTCLYERRIGRADMTTRFPRAWIEDWQSVALGIDKLAMRLQSPVHWQDKR